VRSELPQLPGQSREASLSPVGPEPLAVVARRDRMIRSTLETIALADSHRVAIHTLADRPHSPFALVETIYRNELTQLESHARDYAVFALGHEPQSSRSAAAIIRENLQHYVNAYSHPIIPWIGLIGLIRPSTRFTQEPDAPLSFIASSSRSNLPLQCCYSDPKYSATERHLPAVVSCTAAGCEKSSFNEAARASSLILTLLAVVTASSKLPPANAACAFDQSDVASLKLDLAASRSTPPASFLLAFLFKKSMRL